MDVKNKLFIVVDMQNDFLPKGKLPVKGSDKLATNIQKFLSKYSKDDKSYIAYSMDWHPRNHMSFNQWGKHCVKYSWGARLIKPLNKSCANIIIKKAVEPEIEEFSAFRSDSDSMLYQFIKDKGIDEVYVMGVVKEICVLATCKDALTFGLDTYLLEDLTIALDEQKFQEQIPEGLKLIKTTDIINSW